MNRKKLSLSGESERIQDSKANVALSWIRRNDESALLVAWVSSAPKTGFMMVHHSLYYLTRASGQSLMSPSAGSINIGRESGRCCNGGNSKSGPWIHLCVNFRRPIHTGASNPNQLRTISSKVNAARQAHGTHWMAPGSNGRQSMLNLATWFSLAKWDGHSSWLGVTNGSWYSSV